MPRKRQTQSGAYAQPVSATPGQQYGKGVDEMALERAMPSPQGSPEAAMRGGAPVATPQPQVSLADALMQARGLGVPGGLLNQPTQRPDEPITAGLPIGAGAGPGAVGYPMATPVGRWMRELAQSTGDPRMQRLADRAGA